MINLYQDAIQAWLVSHTPEEARQALKNLTVEQRRIVESALLFHSPMKKIDAKRFSSLIESLNGNKQSFSFIERIRRVITLDKSPNRLANFYQQIQAKSRPQLGELSTFMMRKSGSEDLETVLQNKLSQLRKEVATLENAITSFEKKLPHKPQAAQDLLWHREKIQEKETLKRQITGFQILIRYVVPKALNMVDMGVDLEEEEELGIDEEAEFDVLASRKLAQELPLLQTDFQVNGASLDLEEKLKANIQELETLAKPAVFSTLVQYRALLRSVQLSFSSRMNLANLEKMLPDVAQFENELREQGVSEDLAERLSAATQNLKNFKEQTIVPALDEIKRKIQENEQVVLPMYHLMINEIDELPADHIMIARRREGEQLKFNLRQLEIFYRESLLPALSRLDDLSANYHEMRLYYEQVAKQEAEEVFADMVGEEGGFVNEVENLEEVAEEVVEPPASEPEESEEEVKNRPMELLIDRPLPAEEEEIEHHGAQPAFVFDPERLFEIIPLEEDPLQVTRSFRKRLRDFCAGLFGDGIKRSSSFDLRDHEVNYEDL